MLEICVATMHCRDVKSGHGHHIRDTQFENMNIQRSVGERDVKRVLIYIVR